MTATSLPVGLYCGSYSAITCHTSVLRTQIRKGLYGIMVATEHLPATARKVSMPHTPHPTPHAGDTACSPAGNSPAPAASDTGLPVSDQPLIHIDALGYGPAGIGRTQEGKAVFVEGTAPGDVVAVDIIREGLVCRGAHSAAGTTGDARGVTPRWLMPALAAVAPWARWPTPPSWRPEGQPGKRADAHRQARPGARRADRRGAGCQPQAGGLPQQAGAGLRHRRARPAGGGLSCRAFARSGADRHGAACGQGPRTCPQGAARLPALRAEIPGPGPVPHRHPPQHAHR